jgi:hypothetical protein
MRCVDDFFQPCLSRKHWLHAVMSLKVAPRHSLVCFLHYIVLISHL